jgi:dTDP-4-dehydrorhamnose reductase
MKSYREMTADELKQERELLVKRFEEYKAMNPASADRPHYSILEDQMLKATTDKFLMADWKDAIKAYLDGFDMSTLD